MLRQALVTPEILGELSLAEWDQLLPQARAAGLLARLDILLRERRLSDKIPPQTIPHFIAARRIAQNEHCAMRWEVNRIARALRGIDGTPIVLLKGAAYAIRGLPNARGRISADVDILVAKEKLLIIEEALLKHGWAHIKLEEYDQYFYRRWSHELPPLQHRDRGTVVDVHHTILPPTGRLHPHPKKLLTAAVPVEGAKFAVLAPADMVLHCAAHAFQDGELQRGLRDLVDIDDLLRYFAEPNFWNELVSRAEELDLSRPLFYALRYSQKILATPVPEAVLVANKKWQPLWPAISIMDSLVENVIEASGSLSCASKARIARKALYIRSHWLRMPPHLLIPHLARKSLRSWKKTTTLPEAAK